MEILDTAEVMIPNLTGLLVALGVTLGIIIICIGAKYESDITLIIGCLIFLGSIVMAFIIPNQIPDPTKMKYTVEITDESTFKELVNKGYSFTKLFDTKEIYEIVGDVFK